MGFVNAQRDGDGKECVCVGEGSHVSRGAHQKGERKECVGKEACHDNRATGDWRVVKSRTRDSEEAVGGEQRKQAEGKEGIRVKKDRMCKEGRGESARPLCSACRRPLGNKGKVDYINLSYEDKGVTAAAPGQSQGHHHTTYPEKDGWKSSLTLIRKVLPVSAMPDSNRTSCPQVLSGA